MLYNDLKVNSLSGCYQAEIKIQTQNSDTANNCLQFTNGTKVNKAW